MLTSVLLLQDHALKLWDLRMAGSALPQGTCTGPTVLSPATRHAVKPKPSAGIPGCLAVFAGHAEAVSGFAMQQGDVIAHAGAHVGLISLQGAPYADSFVPTRLSNARGGKDSAALVGLTILPHSRLFIAGTEHGLIKVCH